MVTICWSPENRVSGAKGQTAHHGHCPIVHGSRVVLGQNGLRVSIVGLKAMLMSLPWGISPGSLLGTSSGDRFWILSGQNRIVSRAEQGALVCCSEVTHLPAPRLSARVSLCSWKSYCRVNPREAGNQAALPTGVCSSGFITPPALSISPLQLLSWQRGPSQLRGPHAHDCRAVCHPRQGSITPNLPLWLCTLSKASFSPHDLIPVLPSGPVVPYQLGLVCWGHVWQAGRAVSAGAPGASSRNGESRRRAELVSNHVSLLRGESGKFPEQDKLCWVERRDAFGGE